jgi:hypothetical protein
MKLMQLVVIHAVVVSIIGYSCYPTYDIKYEKGIIPSKVTNFESINTEWDDMNSAGPPHISNQFTLFLSTNRSSSGADFNIHWFRITTSFSQTDGTFEIYSNFGIECMQQINSSYDELGPYILSESTVDTINYSIETEFYRNNVASVLLFSSNRDSGAGQDIFITQSSTIKSFCEDPRSSELRAHSAIALNSTFDDAYATIGPDNKIYFCSNRNGNFDIYSYKLPFDPHTSLDSLIKILTGSSNTIQPELENALNSPADDKCPYIVDNTMLFVSKRTDGFGGFDIWTSTFKNGTWTIPTNMGSTINSGSDEYRPICIKGEGYVNDLMLFSSNRAGGKGGYDIYYVGITR